MKSLVQHREILLKARELQPRRLRIYAFRAVDDPESAHRFAEGHRLVLTNHGFNNVVSAEESWIRNPNVWAVLVDSPDGSKTYGGARIHRYSSQYTLPMQDSVGYLDPTIDVFIAANAGKGLGEICGLWNSVEVAGMGVGSEYLIRSGLAIAVNVGVNCMFAFCSPYTSRMAASFGFFPLAEIGNNGTFPYPTEKLIATVTFQEDTLALPGAGEDQRNFIQDLRVQPIQNRIETARNGISVEVEFNLAVKNEH